MKIEEILVLNEIRFNENRMEKIRKIEKANIRYKKAKNIVIAACRELKIKLAEEEIVNIACKIYR